MRRFGTVKGDEEGTRFLDLKNGSGKCGKGEASSPADATLTMDSKNFFDMFSGKLNPASAFMSGKLKISGDLPKAIKLENLMGSLKSKECIPYLKKSNHAHILNLSPPLNLGKHWFAPHVAYSVAKYGVSMCVLGMAEEFKDDGIAVNALWPKTIIHTAAAGILMGDAGFKYARTAEIMADAAYYILCQDPRLYSGQFLIDDDVVRAGGVADLLQYACVPENADNLIGDGYIDDTEFRPMKSVL